MISFPSTWILGYYSLLYVSSMISSRSTVILLCVINYIISFIDKNINYIFNTMNFFLYEYYYYNLIKQFIRLSNNIFFQGNYPLHINSICQFILHLLNFFPLNKRSLSEVHRSLRRNDLDIHLLSIAFYQFTSWFQHYPVHFINRWTLYFNKHFESGNIIFHEHFINKLKFGFINFQKGINEVMKMLQQSPNVSNILCFGLKNSARLYSTIVNAYYILQNNQTIFRT